MHWLYSFSYLNPNSLSAYCLLEDLELKAKSIVAFVSSSISDSSSAARFHAKLLINIHGNKRGRNTPARWCSFSCCSEDSSRHCHLAQAVLTAPCGDTHGSIPPVGPVTNPLQNHGGRPQIKREPGWDPQKTCPVEPTPIEHWAK